MKSIAIYISSYDGCYDIWPAFFNILDKYWTKCPYPIYLTSNFKEYQYKNLQMLKVGQETTWLNRTIKTLEKIEEEYIIFFLEDYFISKIVDSNEIEKLCRRMQEKKIYYYQLSVKNKLKKNEKYIKSNKSLSYPISLQLAIWNRKKLISYLYEMQLKKIYQTPWDFERFFIEMFKNQTGEIIGVEYDTRDIMGYKNGVLQGKWIRTTLNFYKRRGLMIDYSAREIMTFRETLFYNIKLFLSKNLSRKTKKKLKILLKKVGYKFMTE